MHSGCDECNKHPNQGPRPSFSLELTLDVFLRAANSGRSISIPTIPSSSAPMRCMPERCPIAMWSACLPLRDGSPSPTTHSKVNLTKRIQHVDAGFTVKTPRPVVILTLSVCTGQQACEPAYHITRKGPTHALDTAWKVMALVHQGMRRKPRKDNWTTEAASNFIQVRAGSNFIQVHDCSCFR